MPNTDTRFKAVIKTPKQHFQKTAMNRANKRPALASQQNAEIEDEAIVVSVAAHEFRMKGTSLNGKINATASADLATVFHVRESQVEVDKRIAASRVPVTPLPPSRSSDDAFYREVIDIPLRPRWTHDMDSATIQHNEEQSFEAYLQSIYDRYPPHRLNHFEHNLNVWKQLWKCAEVSDGLVVVADSRHPLFHFPPSLYRYVVHILNKPFVLALNKIDLISGSTLDKWLHYFHVHYPKMHVVTFSSFPHAGTVTCEDVDAAKKRKDKKNYHPVGIDGLWSAWKTLLPEKFAKLPNANAANAAIPLTAASLAAATATNDAAAAATASTTSAGAATDSKAVPATAATTTAAPSTASDVKSNGPAVASSSFVHAELPRLSEQSKVKLEHETKKDRKLRRKQQRKEKNKILVGLGGLVDDDEDDDDPIAAPAADAPAAANADAGGWRAQVATAVARTDAQAAEIAAAKAAGIASAPVDVAPVRPNQIGARPSKNGVGKQRSGQRKAKGKKARQIESDGDSGDDDAAPAKSKSGAAAAKAAAANDSDDDASTPAAIAARAKAAKSKASAAAAAASTNRFAGMDGDDDDDADGDGDDNDAKDEKSPAPDAKQNAKSAPAAASASAGASGAVESHPSTHQINANTLTIGMIGHPNAGKSSLINALTGKYSVGVSATPGYTKNIQTVRLGNSGVQLCDCPGLVFPAVDMPKPLQLLCGIFPVSQLREPYSAVRFLAERLPLVKMYGLKPVPSGQRDVDAPDADDMFAALDKATKQKNPTEWSPWDICEAAALIKNYRAVAGRLDSHRAGMDIIHDALNGTIVLYFDPPATTMSAAAAAANDAAKAKQLAAQQLRDGVAAASAANRELDNANYKPSTPQVAYKHEVSG